MYYTIVGDVIDREFRLREGFEDRLVFHRAASSRTRAKPACSPSVMSALLTPVNTSDLQFGSPP